MKCRLCQISSLTPAGLTAETHRNFITHRPRQSSRHHQGVAGEKVNHKHHTHWQLGHEAGHWSDPPGRSHPPLTVTSSVAGAVLLHLLLDGVPHIQGVFLQDLQLLTLLLHPLLVALQDLLHFWKTKMEKGEQTVSSGRQQTLEPTDEPEPGCSSEKVRGQSKNNPFIPAAGLAMPHYAQHLLIIKTGIISFCHHRTCFICYGRPSWHLLQALSSLLFISKVKFFQLKTPSRSQKCTYRSPKLDFCQQKFNFTLPKI